MPAIKSLEELKASAKRHLQKKKMKATPGNIQVIVAMVLRYCAGARDTMKSVLNFIETNAVSGDGDANWMHRQGSSRNRSYRL
ncbi:hypothetical protein [Candidatus Villigracilis affinis]|uniref:hypothetical protein n=1 Tax=Candidatus Villigracilis affinis TaxID=3140682 RepID=UPI002A22EB8A|nr:hypothetical protein [Anaerolineales bacterium]